MTPAMNDTAVLEAALEVVSDGVLITGPYPSLAIVYANAAFYALTGYSPPEVIGKTPALLEGEGTPADWLTMFRSDTATPTEVTNYRKGGGPLSVDWSIRSPASTRSGEYVIATLRDVTRIRALERHLDQRTLLVDALPVLISFVDNQYRYGEINAAYCRWFDVQPEDIEGHKVEEVLGPQAFSNIRHYMDTALAGERVRFEMTVPYARGGPRPVEAEYIPVHDRHDQVVGFYALVRDLSERRTAERDHLTHIYNRRGFDRLLKTAIATAARYDRPLSLLFLDIDHFKPVNDQCGHTVGDKLLQQVANLLRNLARESDIVCRWGGEEFAVLAPETTLDEAVELAERLRAAIARDVRSPLGPITVSIGVVERRSEETGASLIQRVDQALYWAKEKGRNRVETLG